MNISDILIGLGILCAFWYIVNSLIIYNALQKRGLPVNFFLLRLMAPKYAMQYREVTRAENGKPGALFYFWIISINLTLLFIVTGLILRI